jgi:superoxide reductase
MNVYECKTCGHLEFDQAPAKCLVCRAPGAGFVENPAAIKKPADPKNLTEGDKKHIPQIVVVKECGLIPGGCCTDVHVRVGEIEHVMQEKHFITCLDYYINHRFISRVWLSPELCHPAAALHLNVKSGLVTVVENCNVHGNWMSEATI